MVEPIPKRYCDLQTAMSKIDRYPPAWKEYPSVTEVTDFIAKPGLVHWLKNNTPSAIKTESKKSLEIGKAFHEIVHKLDAGEKSEIITGYPREVQNCVTGYLKWRQGKKLKVVASEAQLCSTKLGYKGTPDRIERSGKKLIIYDWKTAKGIYFDYKVQVVGYKMLYEDIAQEAIDEAWIIRVAKDLPEPMEDSFQPFEAFQIPRHTIRFYARVFMNTLYNLNIYKADKKGEYSA